MTHSAESPEVSPTGSRLWRDRSFWGMTATQFLGAFNDNVYKQLVLLLFVAVPVNGEPRDLQWIALLMFSLPFILFSGFAGYLSDRYPKQRVIRACKVAEIAIMVLAVGGFWLFTVHGLTTAVIAILAGLVFAMGTHSAFFGPGKYGILPELFPESALPSANGVVLMTTFLAIILGSALAGMLLEWWQTELWKAGWICVGISVLGVQTAWLVRKLPPAVPRLQFQLDMLFVPRDIWSLVRRDWALAKALTASTVFWLTAALVQPAVNALGKLQLQEGDQRTSLLVTVISLGIAGGSLLAGLLAGRRSLGAWQVWGAWGMVGSLLALALRGGPHDHWLEYSGSVIALILLGGFTGLFAVPLQVFLQSRPPAADKGRMIATQNLLNWIGIFLSAMIYPAADALLRWIDWPGNGVFALTALLMLPVAIGYRLPSPDDR